MARPLACVLGGIEVVRPLALAGIRSAVVAHPGDPACFSRHTAAVLGWIDPWQHPEALLQRLLEFGSAQQDKPVLYYDGDWDLLLVSRKREQLSEAFRFVVGAPELVEDLVDKSRFQALAARLELPVPAAVRLAPGDAASGAAGLRFPLVVKPLTRQHATWQPISGAKAARADSLDELQALWVELASAGVDVLVQELVPGPESRIESYHVYVDETGEVAGEFCGRKLRTHPTGYGYTTALELTDHEDVRVLGRDLVQRLQLAGVAKFDFKRDDDGSLWLLEVNPRFSLWHHPGARAGVNLPELVYCDLVGLPRPAAARARPGVRWCSLPNDVRAARADGVGLWHWLWWLARCETVSAFAWTDPLPLLRGALWRLRTGRSERRRRDTAVADGGTHT